MSKVALAKAATSPAKVAVKSSAEEQHKMFSRTISSFGPRRLVAAGLTVVMLAVLGVVALTLNTRTAVGAGGGGGCFSTGPVCTFKSQVAFADFGTVSADGCVFTDAFVQGFANLTRPGHGATMSVFVSVSKFNQCTNTFVTAFNIDITTGTGPIFNGTVQFGTKLDTATVSGSAPMFDSETGAPLFTSTINVAWQGFGPTTTFMDNSHFRSPGFMANSHFRGTSRAAEASGVFTDETAGNLATLPSLNASLENDSSGTVMLSHS